MAVVGSAQVLIVPTFTGLQKAIGKGLVKPLQDHTGTRSAGERIGDRVIGGMGKALKAGAVGTIAGASAVIGTALVSGFSRLQAIEQAEAKLAGLGHTTKGVENIMNDALAAVKGTSFGMGEAATVAATVVAAGVKPGEDLQKTLTLVGDAATIAGTDMATMGSIVSKVATADVMQMDVANQMMDAGIPILQMVGDELGVTAEEARKMASDGKISFETFQNALETGVGGAAQESGNTLQGAFKNTVASLGRIGASLLTPLYEAGKGFFNWAMDMLGPIEEWAESLAPKIESVLQGFVGWIKSDLIPAAQRIGDVLSAVAGWVQRNKDYLTPLGVALGVVVGAWVAWYTAIGIWNRIVGIATKVQKAFNFIMNANPILRIASVILAVGAALVWFFAQTETGQKMWAAFTDFIGTSWTWLWENVLEPVFNWISDAWAATVEWFKKQYESWMKPTWDAIVDAALWVWEDILQPTFAWIGDAWANLVEGMKIAWENYLEPAWDAITTAATWLWENALSPIFTWIGDHWHLILVGMKMYWENVLKPVWNVISTVAMWLWNTVLKPIFTFIGNHWDKILTAMKWAWDHILKPAWDAIVTVVTWLWETILSPIFTWIGNKWDDILRGMKIVWENILKPAFEKLGETVTGLKDKFDTAVDNIKKAWDKIKSIAAQPIKFVIEKVLNDGLISGFNKLVDWIPGVNGLKKIPLPKWMDGYHAGGWTGPGSKYQPAGIVHADEFVINKESRRRFEHLHPGLLTHINRHGDLAGYASGGLVQPVRGRFTSGFGASRGRYPHAGVDWAVPVGTPVRAALAGSVARTGWNAVQGRTGIGVLLAHSGNRNTYYGHLSRSHVNVGDQIAKGAILGLSGNTGRSTGPHLHFETWTGGKPIDPMKYMGGLPASEEGGSGWFDPLAPLRAIGDKITSWIEGKFPDGGIIVDAALQGAKGGFDRILNWVSSLLGGSGDSGQDKDGGSGTVRQQVQDVAAKYGWSTGAQWNALSEIIQRESSWNLLAKNPRSSAAGLFQKMQSAHGPVEGTASGQAAWGLDYISGRYGSPSAALAHHNRRGWYADGGHVKPDHFLFRDRGGNLPPGLSMVLNNTGRDEYIMNQRQAANVVSANTSPQEIVGTLYMEDGALAAQVRGVLADPATTRRLSQQMASQSSRDLMGVGARAR